MVVCGVFAFFAVIAGCNSAGNDGSSESYEISFTLDGTDYVVTKGFTAEDVFDAGANGSHSAGGMFFRMGAVGENVTDIGTQGPHIWISIRGSAAGTYAAGDASIGVFLGGAEDYYTKNEDTIDSLPADTRTVEVTLFSEVGGTVEGTFSGELERGAHTVTGSFVVERLADAAVEVPSLWR